MTTLAIRQSGGANIISIPKAVLKALGLQPGSLLKLSIDDHKIILSPVLEELTLEAILKESPKKQLKMTSEDKAWIAMKSVGEEF